MTPVTLRDRLLRCSSKGFGLDLSVASSDAADSAGASAACARSDRRLCSAITQIFAARNAVRSANLRYAADGPATTILLTSPFEEVPTVSANYNARKFGYSREIERVCAFCGIPGTTMWASAR